MSRFPLSITMPRFTLHNCRPICTLLRTCPNSQNPNSQFPLLAQNVSSCVKNLNFFPVESTKYLSTLAASAVARDKQGNMKLNMSKKARHGLPASVFKASLDMCSKSNDLKEALSLYKNAVRDGLVLTVYHYNVLLYLCALNANNNDSNSDCISGSESLEMGFEIFKQMSVKNVNPNEATFTSLTRLAAAQNDPEMAFDLVKKMKDCGIFPKLRSYEPVLVGFCERGDAEKAYEVDEHMLQGGVVAEEDELAALLKVSVDSTRGDKVYEMLHRLRATVRQVSEKTSKIIEGWFLSETSSGFGVENWDVEKVKEGVFRGGGGFHGQGWLGSGKWKVANAVMNETGVCSSCGEKLVCIDIDPKETKEFASSLSSLACNREKQVNFSHFQEWLKKHGPFDAVVDGANIGKINMKNFNFNQLNQVIEKLRKISPSKKTPLIILHIGRVFGGPADSPHAKRLLNSWERDGGLYVTPKGSYDDWYWLYAAVSNKCLVVTNDEMRDHLFQLLGNSIFPRWKEKHQVRLAVSRNGLDLKMPPPYSIVIQESEGGSWHIPTVTGDDLEMPRQWICATRGEKVSERVKIRAEPKLSRVFTTG